MCDGLSKKDIEEIFRQCIAEYMDRHVMPLLKTAVTKYDAILKRIVVSQQVSTQPDLSLLSKKQRQILDQATAVQGNGSDARIRVEAILQDLKGEKVTYALTASLKALLKSRGWGVRCGCGEPAQFMWQRNQRCAEGGLLVLSHQTSGKHAVHSPTTRFGAYSLINKPDRRRVKH